MADLQKAIETIQDMLDVVASHGSCYVYKHNGGDTRLRNVLDCLRARQERENPEPLTLDDLREMDGEPVWIVRIGSNSPEDKEWALVFVEGGFCRTSVGNIAFLALYGKTWIAYRNRTKDALGFPEVHKKEVST